MNTGISNSNSKMDILGVPQLKKEYKTPEYVRAAQKRAYERRKAKLEPVSVSPESTQHVCQATASGLTSTKSQRNYSEDCKKHRLKKKLDKVATNLDVDYMKTVLGKLGIDNEDDLQHVVDELRQLLGRRIEDKGILEVYLAGSKIQPTSVINVMVYHILKDRFTSLTHATEVLSMNYRTLSVNYEKLLDVLQKTQSYRYNMSITDSSGGVVRSSYLSDDHLTRVLEVLP